MTNSTTGLAQNVSQQVRRLVLDLQKKLGFVDEEVKKITSASSTVDHGALVGLADDDHGQYALSDGTRGLFEQSGAVTNHAAAGDPHTQYLTNAEGDAAYVNVTGDTMTGSLAIDAVKPRTGTGNLRIGHAANAGIWAPYGNDIYIDAANTYFRAAGGGVGGVVDMSTYASAVKVPVQTAAAHAARKEYVDTQDAAHVAAVDPHPQYLTPAEGNAAYVNVTGDTMSGNLAIANANVTQLDITTSLAGNAWAKPFLLRRPAAASGDKVQFALGRSLATYEMAEFTFHIAATASTNNLTIGLFGKPEIIKMSSTDVSFNGTTVTVPAPSTANHAARKADVDLVQAAVNAHLADTIAAHASTAISYDGSANSILVKAWLTATDVSTAVAQLAGQLYTPDAETTQQLINALNALVVGTPLSNADVFSSNLIVARHLATGSVIAGKIDAQAVTTATIAAGAITTDKLDALAVTADKIAALAITADKIAAGTITADRIVAKSLTAAQMDANTITAAEIMAFTITASQMATNSITADKILAGSVTTVKLDALAVTAAKIAANTITAGQIAATTITAAELAANSVTAVKLQSDAITSSNYDYSFGYFTNAGSKLDLATGTFRTPGLGVDGATGTVAVKGVIEATALTIRRSDNVNIATAVMSADLGVDEPGYNYDVLKLDGAWANHRPAEIRWNRSDGLGSARLDIRGPSLDAYTWKNAPHVTLLQGEAGDGSSATISAGKNGGAGTTGYSSALLGVGTNDGSLKVEVGGAAKVANFRIYANNAFVHVGKSVVEFTDLDEFFINGVRQDSSAWTNVGFENFFSNFGGAFQTVQYRREGDRVFLRGMIRRETAAAIAYLRMFTLPVGFRPTSGNLITTSQSFNADASGLERAVRTDIQADGQVMCAHQIGAGFWMFFDTSFSLTA